MKGFHHQPKIKVISHFDTLAGSKPQNGVFLNRAYIHQVPGAGRFVCLRVEGVRLSGAGRYQPVRGDH